MNYLSDVAEHQQEGLRGMDAAARAQQTRLAKSLKEGLVKTSIALGNEKEPTSYDTTLKLAMPVPERSAYNNPDEEPVAKTANKKSSIYFGVDRPDYRSENRLNMGYDSVPEDYNRHKAEASRMKSNLMKPNFSLGNGPVEYLSDYQREYVKLNPEYYKQYDEKALAKSQIEENKKAHFSLGKDPTVYRTNTQEALSAKGYDNPAQARAQRELNKALKNQLQKTSVTLGSGVPEGDSQYPPYDPGPDPRTRAELARQNAEERRRNANGATSINFGNDKVRLYYGKFKCILS